MSFGRIILVVIYSVKTMLNTEGLGKFAVIDPEVLRKAKEQIGEDDARREQAIQIIREWMKKQKHFTYPDGNLLFNQITSGM